MLYLDDRERGASGWDVELCRGNASWNSIELGQTLCAEENDRDLVKFSVEHLQQAEEGNIILLVEFDGGSRGRFALAGWGVDDG